MACKFMNVIFISLAFYQSSNLNIKISRERFGLIVDSQYTKFSSETIRYIELCDRIENIEAHEIHFAPRGEHRRCHGVVVESFKTQNGSIYLEKKKNL